MISKFWRRSASGLVVGLVLATGGPAIAHPNIMMQCRVLFNFKGDLINGIGEAWTFDQTFSDELMKDFDADHDGKLSDAESRRMGAQVMTNLGASRYFTYISVDGQDIGKPKASGFRAAVQNGIVSIAFAVPLPQPIDPRQHKLTVEIKDQEFFVYALFATPSPVLIKGAGGTEDGCTPKVYDDKAGAYWGGAIIPQAATLVCK
ncbi:DUF1007 family protein [Jiella sp. MQZ9-1]|uniref:DUF1007 family protein n=1 Tax=Jiella flava TaxID=2816857 RepID=A0A939JT02_9HYPH|nr:DUF1007 family protein [Jiella flava]MCD2470267.1 DUF1007 family protein [Jiella flava]